MISSVITTHCRPKFLAKTLTAASEQCEDIVVVDDSPYASKYQKENHEIVNRTERAKYVHTGGRKGVSSARNTGTHLAFGQYIAFLDDDDFWLPGYINFCRNHLSSQPDLILSAFCKLRNGGRMIMEKVPPPYLKPEDFLIRNPGLRGSNLFIRKESLIRVGGFNEALMSHNDLDLGIRLFMNPDLKYIACPTPFVLFNDHNGERLSTVGSPQKAMSLQLFYDLHSHLMSPEIKNKYIRRARTFWKCEVKSWKGEKM